MTKDYDNQRKILYIDSDDDVESLPTHAVNNIGYYSKAIVADETAHTYILNKQDTWVRFGGGS